MPKELQVKMNVTSYKSISLSSYNLLNDLPKINNVEIKGSKTSSDFGFASDTGLTAEITRATAAEQANTTAINNEITRAKAAEQANSNAITAEVTRATTAENAISASITALETANANKQDKLTAGANITIGADNTISATNPIVSDTDIQLSSTTKTALGLTGDKTVADGLTLINGRAYVLYNSTDNTLTDMAGNVILQIT